MDSSQAYSEKSPNTNSREGVAIIEQKKINDENDNSQNDANPINDSIVNNLLDIPVKLSLIAGGTNMGIKDVLRLTKGNVVELDRMVGEAFEVHVNDKLIALGEVVVVNEKFGIKITKVISTYKPPVSPIPTVVPLPPEKVGTSH